jgi:hypothetical protein
MEAACFVEGERDGLEACKRGIAAHVAWQQSPSGVMREVQRTGVWPTCPLGAKLALAIVVLVSKDVSALPILPVLYTALLLGPDVSIRPCTRFAVGDARLSALCL